MKASELVKTLNVLIEKHGDLIIANDDGEVLSDIAKTRGVYRDYIELLFCGWNVLEE